MGHPGPRRRDIPDKNFMQVAFLCCFRQGVAGMSRDLGRKKFHEKSSIFFTRDKTKFFHSKILGVGGHFGAPTPLDFFEFSPVDFFDFLQVHCVT